MCLIDVTVFYIIKISTYSTCCLKTKIQRNINYLCYLLTLQVELYYIEKFLVIVITKILMFHEFLKEYEGLKILWECLEIHFK